MGTRTAAFVTIVSAQKYMYTGDNIYASHRPCTRTGEGMSMAQYVLFNSSICREPQLITSSYICTFIK